MSRRTSAFVVFAGVCGALFLTGCELLLPEVVPQAPQAPVVVGPDAPVGGATTVVFGTRQANTALLLDDVEVRPASREGRFSVAVGVEAGLNRFSFVAVDAAGRRSPEAVITVVRDVTIPGAVQVALPARTSRAILRDVVVVKPADCIVRLDGSVLDIARDVVSAEVAIALERGVHSRRFACVDAADNEGPVTAIDVERRKVDASVFALTATPAEVGDAEFTLTATCDNDVEARVNFGTAIVCTGGIWTSPVTLVPGVNRLNVTAAFAGESNDEPEENDGLLVAAREVTLSSGEGEGEGEGEEEEDTP